MAIKYKEYEVTVHRTFKFSVPKFVEGVEHDTDYALEQALKHLYKKQLVETDHLELEELQEWVDATEG